MFDGYQVLTISNKIKSADIGGLSKELTERKGTGNYDKERTKFNVEFVPLCSSDLASSTYKTLKNNNVEFNKNNKNTFKIIFLLKITPFHNYLIIYLSFSYYAKLKGNWSLLSFLKFLILIYWDTYAEFHCMILTFHIRL